MMDTLKLEINVTITLSEDVKLLLTRLLGLLEPAAPPPPIEPPPTTPESTGGDPVLPAGATVIFREDWRATEKIYVPAERPVPGGRWSDGSNPPHGYLRVQHFADGSAALDKVVEDAIDRNDGARASMTQDDPRWNDLPPLEGKTCYWLIRESLIDMPPLIYGDKRWFSIAQVKRTDREAPAYTEVNVRGDLGFKELYLVLGGKSYYHPAPQPLPDNTPFWYLLEVKLSRDAAVGEAWIHYRRARFGGKGATLSPEGGAVFMLTAYGNTAPTLHARTHEVTFAVE